MYKKSTKLPQPAEPLVPQSPIVDKIECKTEKPKAKRGWKTKFQEKPQTLQEQELLTQHKFAG